MNTIHNNGDSDRSLNDDLDTLGHDYGRLQPEEPPELLDQAILNSAHRAVEKKSHWMQFGWVHGLTTTAVVVLTLTMVFNQREQTPGFESDMGLDVSTPLQRDNAAKKQVEHASAGLKEKRGRREDAFQAAPAVAEPASEPASEPVETTVGELNLQSAADAGRSMYSANELQSKQDLRDKDITGNKPVDEEQLLDESKSVSDTAESELVSRRIQPAAASKAEELDDSLQKHVEIERQLKEIIRMKQSGDPLWEEKLELFKANNPNYPLPDVLSD